MRNFRGFSRTEGKKSSRLVVIAAEGRYTENIYFNAVKEKFRASNVHVEILERGDDSSNPESVENQVNCYSKNYDLDDNDQLWIVVDRDKWLEKSISEIAARCVQKRYMRFCLSNPCFELWLLLHFVDVDALSESEKKEILENKRKTKKSDPFLKCQLRKTMGKYSESSYDVGSLMPHISRAIAHAKKLDKRPKDRWPQDLGTRVYLLVDSICDIQ